MRLYNFCATIHLDRFPELAMLTRDLQVIVEPLSIEGNMVLVFIRGAAEVTLKVDRSVQNIKHILQSAPTVEWSS